MKVSSAAIGVAAVAAVVGMTGCSADTAKKAADGAVKVAAQPLAALQRATESTKKYGSADVDVRTSGSGTPTTEMVGTYSWGNGLALDAQMDAKSTGMASLTSGDTINVRMTHGSYYYHVTPQKSGPLKGKHWMRVDMSAVLGKESSDALVSSNADPTRGLKSLKYAKDAKVVGKETVLGKETTHYRATLSKEDLGAAGAALSPEDKKSLLGEFTGTVDSISYDVWVDGHDMPVRMKENIGAMKVAMDFKEFGPAKDVKAPPASDTADLTDAVKGQQSGQTAG
ncbi:hypothetical protein OG204_12020 [Streptomyces sp. NBC_01387]|uniref:hypothetical protein n=1 Tax=unclassified Streptomyces TaxID=2593676 RepID=UPI0022518444|nr:hypothetical protein [Streptomyces sp. NBC_01500]MCX4551029.1 hypothetical protein [Streptomyces sp. NBC_01500]